MDWLLVYCLTLTGLCLGQELLTNPGFEEGLNGWASEGFNPQLDTSTVREGSTSLLCTDRTQSWQGPAQSGFFNRGGRYQFNAYVKLFDGGVAYGAQPFYVRITTIFTNGSSTVLDVVNRQQVNIADDWVHLGADFQFPNLSFRGPSVLSIEGPAARVSFYVDDVSLVEIPEYTSWDLDVNRQIEINRKNEIHFSFNVASNFNVNDLSVHIDHTRHLFDFGSVVRSELINSPDYQQYQDVAYYLFNSLTLKDYQWNQDEGDLLSPNYARPINATNTIVKNGVKVQGQSLFSSVPGEQPLWVSPLVGQELRNAVQARISYLTGQTRGKVSQWVVNSDLLQGQFFEDRTGDRTYSQQIFRSVHAADPNANLLLNEYGVLTDGTRNSEYVDKINAFKNANVGLKGVGVQSNFPDGTEPDPTLLQARLNRLARAGVPLYITDLSISSRDEQQKASWYEELLKLYFAHPSVAGVSLAGFWDHDIDPYRALVHGYTYTLDEAGRRFRRLVTQDWSTHEVRSLSSGTSFNIRGFQGNYTVTVYSKGRPIQRTTFSLEKANKAVAISVSGTGSEIQLPPVVDPFQPAPRLLDLPLNLTLLSETPQSRALQTLGSATSSSQSSQLQCVTRVSGNSEVGDDRTVSVSCNTGEVLTGCSSYSRDSNWRRDGEQLSFSGGKATCTAYNGQGSTSGVVAVARCCSLQSLQCSYKRNGPSGTGEHAEVNVPCSGSEFPLGCGTYSSDSESSGTIFTSTFCVAQNDDPKRGVYAFASCCQKPSPSLHCVVMYSEFSGSNVGARAVGRCPGGMGFVITGCNVYAPNGRAAGAFVEASGGEDTCVAINGFQRFGSERGVQATVACCRVA